MHTGGHTHVVSGELNRQRIKPSNVQGGTHAGMHECVHTHARAVVFSREGAGGHRVRDRKQLAAEMLPLLTL